MVDGVNGGGKEWWEGETSDDEVERSDDEVERSDDEVERSDDDVMCYRCCCFEDLRS